MIELLKNLVIVIFNIFEWFKNLLETILNIPTMSVIQGIIIFISAGTITAIIIGILALIKWIINNTEKLKKAFTKFKNLFE